MSSALRPGDVIAADYVIVRKIASGGMGVVYEVMQRSTGRPRALKVLAPHLAEDPKVRERFEREARIASRIESDHVVQVFAAGIHEPGGLPWLMMELLRGEDLNALVKMAGPLPKDEVVEIFDQIGHALGLAHAQGIIHLDLKPENIFRAEPRGSSDRPIYKILDFGIAKVAASGAAPITTTLGSPYWLAPEQLKPKGMVTSSADVWPLGLIAFFLLTGRRYWNAEGGVAPLLMEILGNELEPPSLRCVGRGEAPPFGPSFDAWFAGCVERDPGRRFPDGPAAISALRAALAYDRPAEHLTSTERLLDPEEEESTFPGDGSTILDRSPFAEPAAEEIPSHLQPHPEPLPSTPSQEAGYEANFEEDVETLYRPVQFGRSSDPDKPLPPLSPPRVRPSGVGMPSAEVPLEQSGTGPTEEIIRPARSVSMRLLAVMLATLVLLLFGVGGAVVVLLLRRRSEPVPDIAQPASPAPAGVEPREPAPTAPPPARAPEPAPIVTTTPATPAPSDPAPSDPVPSDPVPSDPVPSPSGDPEGPSPQEMASCIHTQTRRISGDIRRRSSHARINNDLVERVARIRCFDEYGREEEALRAIRSFLRRYPDAHISHEYHQRLRHEGRGE